MTQFARHVVKNATRLSSRALALAPPNTVSVQRSIFAAYRAMYATYCVILAFAVTRPGQGGEVKARGILVEHDMEFIKVMGWSVCMEFLQLFDNQIRELHINYTNIDRGYYGSVQDLINNSCHGNLIQIEFNRLRKFPIDGRFESRAQNVYLNLRNS